MLILEAVNIKKYYRDRLIFAFDRLEIYSGDKIGVVGQNGAGKTTLFNILAGETTVDTGTVKKYCEIAYLKQLSNEGLKNRSESRTRVRSQAQLQLRTVRGLQRQPELEAETVIRTKQKLLKELGVRDKIGIGKVSGGEYTRLQIAEALSQDGVVLFADEPTSNLDYQGIRLLREKLSQVETLLLISHDRTLLDGLCQKIIEVRDGKLTVYEGNFSAYQEQKRAEEKHARFAYEQYVEEKRKLEEALRERNERANSMKKAPARMGNSEARLHKGGAKEKQKKLHKSLNILKTRLEKLEVKEKPKENSQVKFDFSLTEPPRNKTVISCKDLSFGYERENKIFCHAGFRLYNKSKTALIGKNGSGKTTLLNLINHREKEIYLVPKARIGYFYQGFENLDYHKTILENVSENSIQNETVVRIILARLLFFGDDVYKKVGVLSGGERIKVSFAKLFVSQANVLLLDEPTNYLDLTSIEALQNILGEYAGTVLFVSHDRAFVDAVADRLLIVENKQITEFTGNWQTWEESRQRVAAIEEKAGKLEEAVLRMRLSEIIAKMSLPDAPKELLEAEYQKTLAQLKK